MKRIIPFLIFLTSSAAVAGPPQVVWRTHTGDRAEQGAVLLDGRLLVAGTRKLTELDPASGAILRFLLPPDPTAITSAPVHTAAGVTAGDGAGRLLSWKDGAPPATLGTLRRAKPITALDVGGGDRLIAAGDSGCVTYMEPDASRTWSHCTEGVIGRALVSTDEAVLAGDASGRLTVWSASRGAWRWAYEMDAPLAGAPALTDDEILLAGTDGHVYALDRDRGILRWRVHVGDKIHGAPAVGLGVVIVATETRGLVAIEIATGKGAWRSSLSATTATPAILGDLVVVGTQDGRLHAFDAATGARRWGVSLDGPVVAPSLLIGDGIFAVTLDGIAYLLK